MEAKKGREARIHSRIRRWKAVTINEMKAFLHLAENERAPTRGDSTRDRSYKIKPLVDLLISL